MHRSSSNDGNRSSNDGNAPAHLLEDVHVAAEYVEQDSEVVALVVGEGDAGTGIGRNSTCIAAGCDAPKHAPAMMAMHLLICLKMFMSPPNMLSKTVRLWHWLLVRVPRVMLVRGSGAWYPCAASGCGAGRRGGTHAKSSAGHGGGRRLSLYVERVRNGET